ncbi:23S rRNA (uracil(1939)-C(5))-methyltransferase RlmD [Pseudomethylobacillus aquaticus]|uniref:23S rRNA (uracil(1939)-C(5))-methyltransferase RlmD n=1 Tax=Pseudomethylobacillus aquaticus TaxID=2676064 RepID=A0A3N0V7L8_9PROT|nr:23S rRNA (uracil(1939)-C(5))-methyltransferase RlmD [Pseudomethylobacillus aquaticus]ROH88378.1 23S rRNA (uracil(1939)-C(5))-methyltransferase RlmD [Pseudomethylobacillus aquaticus]
MQTLPIAQIESLDQEGRGVAHVDGKTIFIDGALIGETVTFKSHRSKKSYEVANVVDVLTPSGLRTKPKCKHFGMCGGCALQHLDFSGQVAAKQRLLEADMWHIGRVRPETMMPPIYGPAWGYRHKARLRVRHVPKKGGVLVGFNEKASSYVAHMDSCEVLPPKISALIVPLQQLVAKLSVINQLPQIEVAVGEHATVLVLRILEALQPQDTPHLKAFADEHGVQIWTQSKGPDTVKPFYPLDGPGLSYSLPEYELTYPFKPTEFTQVNPHINRVMLRRAMQLLDPQKNERIADFFCGLGNFTLPIARSGASVLGMEGSASLVARAVESAALNGLAGQVEFREADLFKMTPELLQTLGSFDKWLIDPPRDGALDLVKSLPDAVNEEGVPQALWGPERIVYVSCNPSTLARDAGVLVNLKGYRLRAAGVINMFPHTAHVESIAWFERG